MLWLLAGSTPARAEAISPNVHLIKNFAYTGGSDLDFSGDYVYAGHIGGGVHVLDVSGATPKHLSFIPCPGSQNDVAVVRPGLLALGYARGFCGKGPGGSGVQLIDVRNPRRPRFLGAVNIPGGTHTLTVYPGEPVIYSSPGGLGPDQETIIDVSNPTKPEIVTEHSGVQTSCHDVGFLITEEVKLAYCPGLTETQIWDVSDPLAPVTIGHIVNPLMFFPHSAVASPDGKLLVLGDEAFAGHECATQGQGPLGSLYFYDLTVPQAPVPVGHYGPPRGAAPISLGLIDPDWCTAHLYNFIPGTSHLVAAWYTGGTNVLDLTIPAVPREVAYFQKDDSSAWASYWYRGRIYINDERRGIDVIMVDDLAEGAAAR